MSEPTGARRYGVGGGDAYYDAVKYGGYEGTREQFGRDQAEFAQNAAAVAEAKETVERDTEEVRNTKNTFENTTVPEAIRALNQEGEDQILAITQKGEEVSQQVETVGTEQKDAVANEGRARVEAVEQAGTTQVQAVNDAGTTQVGNVNQAGEDQVDAVEQAGADQVQAVTNEGTTQIGAVNRAGSTQVQAVEDKGDEVLHSIPSDYTELVEDVDNLKESISDLDDETTKVDNYAFEQGTISSTTGSRSPSTTRIRTTDFIKCEDATIKIDNALQLNLFWYKESEHTEGNFISTTGFINDKSYSIEANKPADAKYYKLALKFASGNSVPITPTDITNNDCFVESSYINYFLENMATKQQPFDCINVICKIENKLNELTRNSGCCFAKKDNLVQFWSFNYAADDHSNTAAWGRKDYDPINKTFSAEVMAYHNLGHVNSCGFNSAKDAFICGNGSSDKTLSGQIYIIESAFEKTDLLINDALIIDFSTYGSKVNAVWGDDNNGKNNIIFAITNDGYDIYRILLGEDATVLESGTLIKNTGFNGTYKILNHWEYGDKKEDYPNVVQGAFYYNKKLYWGFGHSTGIVPIHIVELFDNGTVKTSGINYITYDDNGNQITQSVNSITNYENEAFCVFSTVIYTIKI